MNKQDILLLYKYNAWANFRILTAAENVSTEQFLAPSTFPHGSLRNTLTHILFADWIWRTRWMGESLKIHLKPEDFPTLASLRKRWDEEEIELDKFVNSLTDEKLNTTFPYKNTRGEALENILWQAMAHVVNHGTQHRSEAAAMLTEFRFSPGDIDMIVFLREIK
jgi:uncharacterized damage-inducible protein DinB